MALKTQSLPRVDELQWPCELSPGFKQALLACANMHSIGLERVVFSRARERNLAYVIEGCAALTTPVVDDASTSAVVFGRGDWLGAAVVISKMSPLPLYMEVLQPIRYLTLAHTDVERLAAEYPEMYRLLYSQMTEVMPRVLQSMVINTRYSVELRVIYALVEVLSRMPQVTGALPELNISQSQIALIAGISRQRVNGVLRSLSDKGILELGRGRIMILSPVGLHDRLKGMTYKLHDPTEQ